MIAFELTEEQELLHRRAHELAEFEIRRWVSLGA
jgi:hypothetical protein